MAAKSISISVTGNAAPLRKSLTKAEKDLKRFSAQAKTSMKSAALAFGVAGGSAVLMASRVNRAYEEMATADARIMQVAKSMNLFGMETGKTSRRLQELARATALQTGVDANAIKLTQAKLLTFKQIAVSADEAGGAFDRATQAAVDMAAAGFGEASQNATQLGKALQDPIKGITALARSGVTFTKQEKEQIRVLVESNQILKAQDLILSAIEMQVGGTATATANASDKMREGMRAVKEEIGQGLAPAFDVLAVEAGKFSSWAKKNSEIVAAAAIALGGLVVAIGLVKAAMATATAISAAYAAAQAAVAASNIAVQASTVVGIATATIAAAAIVALTAKVYSATKAQNAYSASVANATEETGNLKNMIDAAKKAADDKRAADEAAALAAEKAAAAAEKAKEAEKKRYENLKNRLKDAKAAIRSYVQEISNAINREVSLGNAFSDAADQQQDASDRITEALKTRREAYAELQQAKATGDTKAYASALEKVATAEQGVTEAQAVKPKNYSQIFAEQISAAKQFAGYIKQLAPLLSRGGLQQILDLGPVAGAQVAKDLLAGTGGLSISQLNADIADIAASGTAAGMAIPGFSETLGATAGRASAGNYYITIEAGVSSPTDIAKTVQGILQTYGVSNGGVAVKTKSPKASAGKRKK